MAARPSNWGWTPTGRRRYALLALWLAHGGWVLLAMLVSAAMLGHALARIGPEKLAVKWWLYFMQSGGLAIAFVIPAIWVSLSQHGRSAMALRESAMWLLAFLAMGLAFYLV